MIRSWPTVIIFVLGSLVLLVGGLSRTQHHPVQAKPLLQAGCRSVEGRIEFLPDIRRHKGRLAGVLVATVAHAIRAVGIVAMQDFVNPNGGIGGHLGNRCDRVSLDVQQDDLPVRPFDGIMGPSVALLQIINRQVVRYL
jgi:hypothetical protein